MVIESESFFFGFLVGFVLSGYLGWIMGRIRAARGAAKKSGQAASVTVKSEKSPGEIVREATAASFRAFLWIVLLLASVTGILYFLWLLLG